DSGRPDRTVAGHAEIESVQLDHDDPVDLYSEVAKLAQTFLGTEITTSEGTRALTPNDVAVVAGDNLSVNGIAGCLSNLGRFPGITVGTADRPQGRRWNARVGGDRPASAWAGSDRQ